MVGQKAPIDVADDNCAIITKEIITCHCQGDNEEISLLSSEVLSSEHADNHQQVAHKWQEDDKHE